jgi:hypothetical protein
MKLISLLAAAALLGLGVSVLDFTFSAASLGLFGLTASVLFLLGVARDYSPRRPYWQPTPSPLLYFPTRRPNAALQRAAA